MAILDSGNRTEFATGAVRDMREGKGRMDLMPLEVVCCILEDSIFIRLSTFLKNNNTALLYDALRSFAEKAYDDCYPTMFLEVGKQFEEGAKKYGENNWQKGIEPKYYIDSAIRHYLKWRRGDKDEPHDRAFVWNIMCCIWEVDWHEKTPVEKKDDETEEEKHGCSVCRYGAKAEHEEPCRSCMRNHIDKFEAKESETVKHVKDALNAFGAKVMGELNRTCTTCRHSLVKLSPTCHTCRYYCNWEPKEESDE